MKHIFILLFLFLPLSVKAQGQAFFDTLYDVPVMEGLIEIPEMSLTFDKPGGRISQAGAAMNGKTVDNVQGFYSQTLPQMGWQALETGVYVREEEKLILSFEEPDIVKFLLKPV